MALQKDYDYKGKTANYWKITKVVSDFIKNTTLIELFVYWNRDSRMAHIDNYLNHREIRIVNKTGLTREQAYEEVKATNWFDDAIDVLEN